MGSKSAQALPQNVSMGLCILPKFLFNSIRMKYLKTQLWISSGSECTIEYAGRRLLFKRLEKLGADLIALILLFSMMFFWSGSLLFLRNRIKSSNAKRCYNCNKLLALWSELLELSLKGWLRPMVSQLVWDTEQLIEWRMYGIEEILRFKLLYKETRQYVSCNLVPLFLPGKKLHMCAGGEGCRREWRGEMHPALLPSHWAADCLQGRDVSSFAFLQVSGKLLIWC